MFCELIAVISRQFTGSFRWSKNLLSCCRRISFKLLKRMQSTLKTVLFKTGIFGFRSTFSRKLAPLQNRILFRFSSTTYDFDNTNKSPNVEETNEDFSDLQEYLDDPSKQFLLLNQVCE